jgi:hypothetical protein
MYLVTVSICLLFAHFRCVACNELRDPACDNSSYTYNTDIHELRCVSLGCVNETKCNCVCRKRENKQCRFTCISR